MSTKNAQRLSQIVSTFGPGSMVDLPTRSVVIGGLDLWQSGTQLKTIDEPRLAERLEKTLKAAGRLAPDAKLQLRQPPVEIDGPTRVPAHVEARVFPEWMVCERVEPGPTPDVRRRRLVHFDNLQTPKRNTFLCEDGKKTGVTPIRFVCACDRGHLADIGWRFVVHGAGNPCQQPMWMEERGTSADTGNTAIVCGCGKRMSLREAFLPGRLGKCRGERPWLGDREECDKPLKLLIRTATNTYFPQIATVISLPQADDELSSRLQDIQTKLAKIDSVEKLALYRQLDGELESILAGYDDATVFAALERLRAGQRSEAGLTPKLAEFDTFASGRARIGTNEPGSRLHAETLPDTRWRSDEHAALLAGIDKLVAVHRLREVSALYGFTRFEAAPTAVDGDFEDIALAVDGAPITRDATWLPAIEQFGEGLFLQLSTSAVRDWLRKGPVIARADMLAKGHARWAARFQNPPEFPGIPYILLHALSHALMAEIALDCGYPASALKERIYALGPAKGAPQDRFGILLYTASAGAQGTLGGLVAIAERFPAILAAALARVELCSHDPVCCDHVPDAHSGDRATHGAACHACLLVAETSCENRNLLLDRTLLVSTLAEERCAFFG